MTEIPRTCPHCGLGLKNWRVPEEASWEEEFFLVCFNNDCSYYREGWVWMKEQYNQHVSYRYMINPATGAKSMLPVWSDSAMTEMIIKEHQGDQR